MNQRIDQLWAQALDLAVPETYTQLSDSQTLKIKQVFAQLIVRECLDVVEEYGLSLIGSDENYLGETLNLSIKVQEAGDKIKQHFGVDQ